MVVAESAGGADFFGNKFGLCRLTSVPTMPTRNAGLAAGRENLAADLAAIGGLDPQRVKK